ncbi:MULTISPECIES: DUF2721 domain-containing protein [unclassified Cyanobium]|jgi:hypothetical protein|uniref:DUF2721 domain-containing protein n=1 Tax=unclassified Cyanobium TaxID=2627006 RepID=UPI0016488EE2|nr:DUF2721 domain-containing protein [Cyanobium sp. NS01]MBE9153900.1 DUF2721 domain-containing protein [Cyanobium sp. LEGE 06113]QNI70744.1 uncharacterized conserved membrane protein DUF2721 [Cyanobium sp. NS01]
MPLLLAPDPLLAAAQTATVETLARAIQLSVAPVFLLAGIGGLLVVLTNRLARIVDRSRRLQEQMGDATVSRARQSKQELQLQKRRMTLVLKAIELCTVTILLVALVVAIVFVSVVTAIDLALVVVPLFVAAMLCLMVAVLLFMREVQLAAAQLRRWF